MKHHKNDDEITTPDSLSMLIDFSFVFMIHIKIRDSSEHSDHLAVHDIIHIDVLISK